MKIHKFTLSLFLGALLFTVPVLASAAVIRSGEEVVVDSDQTVEGDFYGVGGASTISGEIEGDAYVVGGTVTVNAPIRNDLTVIGGTVQVHGPVGDDVRIVAGEVTLADAVDGDVVVLGGVLRVLSTASISGDVVFYGDNLVLDGAVGGSVFGSARDLRINSSVTGDIDVATQGSLTLGDRAEVLGNITYKSGSEIVRSQNAVVVGDIQQETLPASDAPIATVLLPMLASLFVALIAFVLFRPFLVRYTSELRTSYGLHGLVGLAAFVAIPFVAIILMVSVLGFLAGVLLLSMYIALLIASWVLAIVFVGTFLRRLYTKDTQITLLSVVLGVVAFEVLALVPFVGPLAVFACVLIALGSISTHLYRVLLRK